MHFRRAPHSVKKDEIFWITKASHLALTAYLTVNRWESLSMFSRFKSNVG